MTHYHPIPYPFLWVNKKVKINVTKQCKTQLSINADFIDASRIGCSSTRYMWLCVLESQYVDGCWSIHEYIYLVQPHKLWKTTHHQCTQAKVKYHVGKCQTGENINQF